MRAVIGIVALLGLALGCGTTFHFPPGPLTEATVMAYLPPGSQLGRYPDENDIDMSVINADVDGDGQDEAIVAYYSVADDPPGSRNPPEANEAYYDRARVRVLYRQGNRYRTQWESEGFGYCFTGGGDYHAGEAYRPLHFSVQDIVGDGVPVIMCTRSGYGAMGTVFKVWRWNGKTYEEVLCTNMTPRLAVSPSRNAACFVLDRDNKGGPLNPPEIFAWSADQRRFTALDTPSGDVRLP